MPFRKCEKTCLVSCLKEEQRSIAPKCLLLSKAPTQTINRLFRAVRRACGCSKRHWGEIKKIAPEKFLFSFLGAGTSTSKGHRQHQQKAQGLFLFAHAREKYIFRFSNQKGLREENEEKKSDDKTFLDVYYMIQIKYSQVFSCTSSDGAFFVAGGALRTLEV